MAPLQTDVTAADHEGDLQLHRLLQRHVAGRGHVGQPTIPTYGRRASMAPPRR